VDQARRRDAELVLVRAYAASSYGGSGQFQVLMEEAAHQIVTVALTEALGSPPRDVRIRVVVREGRPGRVLTESADRAADLIVIGGSRPRRFGRLRGTVARDCSRLARCPVVMVPAPEMAFIGSTASLGRRTAEAAQAMAAGRGPFGPPAAAAHR
jgi:hypothetical protein